MKQDRCAGSSEVVATEEVVVAGPTQRELARDVPDGACGWAGAVLNGAMSGDVRVAWSGGDGGCPGVSVVAPAVLTCWEEGLPPGRVAVAIDVAGAGNVTLRILGFRP
jgi:hypothetical protein